MCKSYKMHFILIKKLICKMNKFNRCQNKDYMIRKSCNNQKIYSNKLNNRININRQKINKLINHKVVLNKNNNKKNLLLTNLKDKYFFL